MRKGILRYVSILMLALLVVNMSSPVSVYFSYQLNKEYIATQLCENKDRPELACNGQCVLMKKLKAFNTQTKDHSSNSFVLPSLSFDYLQGNTIVRVTSLFIQENVATAFSYVKSYMFQYISSIGHPPQAITY